MAAGQLPFLTCAREQTGEGLGQALKNATLRGAACALEVLRVCNSISEPPLRNLLRLKIQ